METLKDILKALEQVKGGLFSVTIDGLRYILLTDADDVAIQSIIEEWEEDPGDMTGIDYLYDKLSEQGFTALEPPITSV